MIRYSNITFVIPAHPDQKVIQTLESIPPESKVIVRRDATRGMARNVGVLLAKTDYIIFADSDIKFSTSFLDYVISLVDDRTIVGLAAYYPSPLLLSRFMMFKKSIWFHCGGLGNIHHGEESHLCLSALEKDYKLVAVPRESVYHYPHKKSKYKNEYLNLLWLIKKHPTFPIRIIKSFLYKMKVSDYADDKTLPVK